MDVLMETVEEFMQRYFTEEPSAKYFSGWEAYSAPFRAKYFISDYEARHQKIQNEMYSERRAARPMVLSIEQNEDAALVFIAHPRDFNHERCYDLQRTETGWRIAGSYFKCFACKGRGMEYGYEENKCSSCNGVGWKGNPATRRIKQSTFTQRIRQSSFAQSLSVMNEAECTGSDKSHKPSEEEPDSPPSQFESTLIALSQIVSDIEDLYAEDVVIGSRLLERFSGYLEPGRLLVLSGDSHCCNESFASLLVHHILEERSWACGVYCRSAKEFCREQLAITSGIGLVTLSSACLEDEDWEALTDALARMNDAPLHLENLPTTLETLTASLRNYAFRCKGRIARKKPCPALIVGLQQMLEAIVVDGMTEAEGVALILRELKQLATELQLPIIVFHDSIQRGWDAEHLGIADATGLLKARANKQETDPALCCYFSMNLNGKRVIAPTLMMLAASIMSATCKRSSVREASWDVAGN